MRIILWNNETNEFKDITDAQTLCHNVGHRGIEIVDNNGKETEYNTDTWELFSVYN